MTKFIPLTRGHHAIVDDEDYDMLMQWKWYFNDRYAVRDCAGRSVLMHRHIANAPSGIEVDHKNRNMLDNRRLNLRSATRAQQMYNRGKYKVATSSFKGVYWSKQNRKWRARIKVNHTCIHLGYFALDADAARAYDAAARKHFGDFAYLNFPDLAN